MGWLTGRHSQAIRMLPNALAVAPNYHRIARKSPGLANTAQPRCGMNERGELAAAYRTIPLGHIAQKEMIADAAALLTSDDLGFITGQRLQLNGGCHLGRSAVLGVGATRSDRADMIAAEKQWPFPQGVDGWKSAT